MNTTTTGTWLVALAATLAGLGCGHVESRAVAFDPSVARSQGVTVIGSNEPKAGHDLGTVVARGGQGSSVNALYGELVRQTRELGGNALVVESQRGRIEEGQPIYTALSSAHDCGASCAKGDTTKTSHEATTVELRGKAMWLSPDELKTSAERRAP